MLNFNIFHYIVKLEIYLIKMLKTRCFTMFTLTWPTFFRWPFPNWKQSTYLGMVFGEDFPTDQQLPNGDAVYPTASLMLNPSVSVKWTMCKQPWHGQNSHTRIQKSALYYWIPFKRKSMVQLDNYSGWDDLWPWNIRLTCQPNGFLGAFLSLPTPLWADRGSFTKRSKKTDVANLWKLHVSMVSCWAIWSTNWIERPLKIVLI